MSFIGDIFPFFFIIIFVIVMGGLFLCIVRSVVTWNKNEHSPVLTVDASAVSRRTHISTTHHSGGGAGHMHGHGHSSTRYFVTFQVESGDRMELPMDSSEYAYIAEGDRGKLTFQGTRFLKFERV